MATRLYLDATGAAAPISPAPDAGWEDVSILARALATTSKGGEAMSDVAFSDSDATNKDVLFRQYVSPPLAPGQALSARSYKAQVRCRETSPANQMFMRASFRIIAGDGATVNKVLGSMIGSAAESYDVSLRNLQLAVTVPVYSYTTVAGDRIVVEIGLGGDPNSGFTHSATMRLGSSPATDLPENNTETNDWAPWAQLPDTLAFSTDPTPADSAPASDAQAAAVGSARADSASLTDGIVVSLSGVARAYPEDGASLEEGSTRAAGAALSDSAPLSDAATPVLNPPWPVGEQFAGAGLSVEWAGDRWDVATAGLMAEWVQSRRRLAFAGLMIDYFPYTWNADFSAQFKFSSTCAADVDGAALGPNKLVVCWKDPSDGLESVRVRAGVVDGAFVDFPASGKVFARPGFGPRVCAVGPSKFVVAFVSSLPGVALVAGRVDLGGDVSKGGQYAAADGNSAVLDAAGLDDSKFAVAYADALDSDRVKCVVGELTADESGEGLGMALGSAASVTTRSVDVLRLSAVDSARLVAIYRDLNTGGGYARVGAVSGLFVSWGAEQLFAAAWDGIGDVASLSDVRW
jgi:hypothetical protein